MLGTILVALAFVFACFAAFSWPTVDRVNWIGLSLACYFASLLFGHLLR